MDCNESTVTASSPVALLRDCCWFLRPCAPSSSSARVCNPKLVFRRLPSWLDTVIEADLLRWWLRPPRLLRFCCLLPLLSSWPNTWRDRRLSARLVDEEGLKDYKNRACENNRTNKRVRMIHTTISGGSKRPRVLSGAVCCSRVSWSMMDDDVVWIKERQKLDVIEREERERERRDGFFEAWRKSSVGKRENERIKSTMHCQNGNLQRACSSI